MLAPMASLSPRKAPSKNNPVKMRPFLDFFPLNIPQNKSSNRQKLEKAVFYSSFRFLVRMRLRISCRLSASGFEPREPPDDQSTLPALRIAANLRLDGAFHLVPSVSVNP